MNDVDQEHWEIVRELQAEYFRRIAVALEKIQAYLEEHDPCP